MLAVLRVVDVLLAAFLDSTRSLESVPIQLSSCSLSAAFFRRFGFLCVFCHVCRNHGSVIDRSAPYQNKCLVIAKRVKGSTELLVY